MKFAIVNGEKVEPSPKVKGICPHCNSEVIAKCGKAKVWHWAHTNLSHCDQWWESETEWHRKWKNHFPIECQEVSHIDLQTGEKHIADVKNTFGLVIEFQHSLIKDEERISRENFYKKMVWVIDGCRNDFDKTYFKMGLGGTASNSQTIYKINWYGQSRLLHNWGNSQVKVFIDFGTSILWLLVLYDNDRKTGLVTPILKKTFIDDCLNGIDIGVVKLLNEDNTNIEKYT